MHVRKISEQKGGTSSQDIWLPACYQPKFTSTISHHRPVILKVILSIDDPQTTLLYFLLFFSTVVSINYTQHKAKGQPTNSEL